eukprot:954944-Pelagomonas_calceolata.AAC.9
MTLMLAGANTREFLLAGPPTSQQWLPACLLADAAEVFDGLRRPAAPRFVATFALTCGSMRKQAPALMPPAHSSMMRACLSWNESQHAHLHPCHRNGRCYGRGGRLDGIRQRRQVVLHDRLLHTCQAVMGLCALGCKQCKANVSPGNLSHAAQCYKCKAEALAAAGTRGSPWKQPRKESKMLEDDCIDRRSAISQRNLYSCRCSTGMWSRKSMVHLAVQWAPWIGSPPDRNNVKF